jgi:hypothetical protein
MILIQYKILVLNTSSNIYITLYTDYRMKYASSPYQNPIPIQCSDNHEPIFNHHEENKKNTVFNQLSHAVYSH